MEAINKASESRVEGKLRSEARRRGWLTYKLASPGTAGMPDRLVITGTGKVVVCGTESGGRETIPGATQAHTRAARAWSASRDSIRHGGRAAIAGAHGRRRGGAGVKYEPHDYQRYCTQRIIDDAAVGLMLDMGLGKSVITLTAIDELMYNRMEVDRVLIIAPKKVAQSTWSGEAAKWDHTRHLRMSLILGSAAQRERALAAAADVYVINRDNVKWLVEKCMHDWPFDMVVVDESSSFKDARSKRWRALKLVLPAHKAHGATGQARLRQMALKICGRRCICSTAGRGWARH